MQKFQCLLFVLKRLYMDDDDDAVVITTTPWSTITLLA